MCVCVLSCFGHVQLFVTLRTVTHQAPLSMGFSSKHTGVGYHALLQGIFPTQGSNLHLLTSPAFAGRFFTTSATWEAPQFPYLSHFSLSAASSKDMRLLLICSSIFFSLSLTLPDSFLLLPKTQFQIHSHIVRFLLWQHFISNIWTILEAKIHTQEPTIYAVVYFA